MHKVVIKPLARETHVKEYHETRNSYLHHVCTYSLKASGQFTSTFMSSEKAEDIKNIVK